MSELSRITLEPIKMGRPSIRGMRVTVGMIGGQIGSDRGMAEVLEDDPYLEKEKVLQALRHAAWRVRPGS